MIVYYHQLDPYLIHFTGNFGIRWYSLAYIAAALFAYYAGLYLIRKGRLNIPSEKLMDVVVYGAMGAVIGGRLGYCLFYSPDLFVSFDKSFPFWGALKIHQGGMASHGGILGFLAAQLIYAYRYKLSVFSLLDIGAMSAAVGFFFGRIANFINGELYGRVVEGSTWFAVRFPSELSLWASQPEIYKKQLLSLKELLPSLGSFFESSLRIPSQYEWGEWISKAIEGDRVYKNYISYICGLIMDVSSKTGLKEMLEPLLSLRYPSQLYQSFFGGFMPFLILSLFWLKPRKPGFIALVWVLSYLSFRIFTEFFRQPDSHIGFQFLDLTRGQWLSIFLYIAVIIYAYFVYKQKPKGFFNL